MKFSEYLRDNVGKFLACLAFGALFLAILLVFKLDIFLPISFSILYTLLCAFLLLSDFFRKKSFYNDLQASLHKLDQKYLLPEIIKRPYFLEGKIFYDALQDTNKSMNDQTSKHKNQMIDFRDFIELWVHEVKTPLSGLTLSPSSSDKSSRGYINAIENYIEQALFYSKMDSGDKDYVIKKISLEKIVNDVIRNNKHALINQKVKINIGKLNKYVYSDPKWLGFIINQIMLNSIKYHSKKPELTIRTIENNNEIILTIEDNGIGIKSGELKCVFEKGFTGSNDRKTKSSTGMGLYIADKLSQDLSHKLTIKSELNKYTEVQIHFGKNDFTSPRQ